MSPIAPTPGHLLQRFEKIDEFPIRKRAEDPGIISANKTPAIRDKALHRIADTKVGVPARKNAIVLGPTCYVIEHWTKSISHIYHVIVYRCRKFLWQAARFLIRGFPLTFRRTPACHPHGPTPVTRTAGQDDKGQPQFRRRSRTRKTEYLSRQYPPARPRSQSKSPRFLRSLQAIRNFKGFRLAEC